MYARKEYYWPIYGWTVLYEPIWPYSRIFHTKIYHPKAFENSSSGTFLQRNVPSSFVMKARQPKSIFIVVFFQTLLIYNKNHWPNLFSYRAISDKFGLCFLSYRYELQKKISRMKINVLEGTYKLLPITFFCQTEINRSKILKLFQR